MSLPLRLELLVAACLALGWLLGSATGTLYKIMEERRSSAEAGVGRGSSPSSPSLADPSRPPRSFEVNCRAEGRQFIAWRDADGDRQWRYACLDAWLTRPEVILGR